LTLLIPRKIKEIQSKYEADSQLIFPPVFLHFFHPVSQPIPANSATPFSALSNPRFSSLIHLEIEAQHSFAGSPAELIFPQRLTAVLVETEKEE
jgi:hypothetical protein